MLYQHSRRLTARCRRLPRIQCLMSGYVMVISIGCKYATRAVHAPNRRFSGHARKKKARGISSRRLPHRAACTPRPRRGLCPAPLDKPSKHPYSDRDSNPAPIKARRARRKARRTARRAPRRTSLFCAKPEACLCKIFCASVAAFLAMLSFSACSSTSCS